jgi:ligand-binding SRPBCC domain-containing protein
MTRLLLETTVAAPPERCIELALTVETHVEKPGSRERVVAGVMSGRMGLNDTVTWESRLLGLPIRMTSKITQLDAPHRFVDEMQRGPFKSWRHVHRFERTDTGTLMTDDIDYRVPLGPAGLLVDRLFLRRYMRRLVSELAQYIQTLAKGSSIEGSR